MKLIVQYDGVPMKRIVHVYQTDTLHAVMKKLKVRKGTLQLNGNAMSAHSTVRDNKLRSCTKLLLSGHKALRHAVRPAVHVRTLPPDATHAPSSCMITLENKTPRSLMSCGHAINPQSLYEYCLSEVRSGKTEWRCPYIDPKDTNALFVMCGCAWDMEEVQKKACLTNKEEHLLKRHIKRNVREKNRSCNMFRFNKETLAILETCPRKCIAGIPDCPTKRACPRCGGLLEHKEGCRMMTCEFPGCRHKFCFVCLSHVSVCRADCKTVTSVQGLETSTDGGYFLRSSK